MPRQLIAMENGDDSKYDDIELFFWETNDDDDDDDTTSTTNDNTNTNTSSNKYDFTFDSDDGDAILKEGELSDEEIRLKELYASGLASYKSSSSSPGVTFGLDDIYDDNYGKEKTKRKKGNDNDWFGTYSNKKSVVLDGTIDKGSMARGGRAEKFLADRSKKHPLSTPELEAADGWSDEGLEEYDGLKDE